MEETVAQLSQQLATLQAELAQFRGGAGGKGGKGNDGATKEEKKIEEKKYKRVKQFAGGKDGAVWREWSHQFRVATRMASEDMEKAMKVVEKEKSPVTAKVLASMPGWNDCDLIRRSVELYDILNMLCEGEALIVVLGVEEMDGLAAWQKLHELYNPRTMARVMQRLMRVVTPQKLQDVKQVTTAVERWESDVKELNREHGETINEKTQMAILTMMCPPGVQDIIFQSLDENTKYIDLKAKITALANNRAMMAEQTPVPMEMGNVQQRQNASWIEEDGLEVGIDGVGRNVQCFNCNQWGHFSRDCPKKGKGKGKGNQENQSQYMKGSGKGGKSQEGGKGQGKGLGNWGKGFSGQCFTCGKTGHRAAECRSGGRTFAVEQQNEEVSVEWLPDSESETSREVGSVWMMAAEVKMKKVMPAVKTRNRWGPLRRVTEDIVDDEIECGVCWPEDLSRCSEHCKPTVQETCNGSKNGVKKKKAAQRRAEIEMNTHKRTNAVKIIGAVEAKVQEVAKRTSLDGKKCGMVFHLTKAKRMLASAERIAAAGNMVSIGPKPENCYVLNLKTNRKIKLKKRGGTYEMNVMVKCGTVWKEVNVTVDSGAEECVMPHDWFPEAEFMEKKDGVRFMGADGSDLGNFGRRLIEFVPKEDFTGFIGQA